jgi:hypothetical protein
VILIILALECGEWSVQHCKQGTHRRNVSLPIMSGLSFHRIKPNQSRQVAINGETTKWVLAFNASGLLQGNTEQIKPVLTERPSFPLLAVRFASEPPRTFS